MSDETIVYCVIEVKATVPEEQLDADDLGVEGTYAYSFYEGEAPRLEGEALEDGTDRIEEHALDLFHGKVAIGTLEDFSIIFRKVVSFDELPEDADLHRSTAVIFGKGLLPVSAPGPRP